MTDGMNSEFLLAIFFWVGIAVVAYFVVRDK